MTIRRTLIGLYLLLGVALCVSVAAQTIISLGRYQQAQALSWSNQAREQLARSAVVLAEERTYAYLALVGGQLGETSALELRRETDEVLAEAATTLGEVQGGEGAASLERLRQDLESLRDQVDQGEMLARDDGSASLAADVLSGYSRISADIFSLRGAILAQEHPPDPATASAFQMRRYASVLLESLELNQALIGGLLVERSPEAAHSAWSEIRRNAGRAELAYEFLQGQAAITSRPIRRQRATLEVAYADRYRPMEQDLLASPETEIVSSPGEAVRTDAYVMLWSARQVARVGAELQEALFSFSRGRLEVQRQQAARRAIVWALVFLGGLAAVAAGARTVLHRVIGPLDRLRHSMVALAGGNLGEPLPEQVRQDEIGAMADTLRAFRANAVRRERLQKEREALHERVRQTHEQLRQAHEQLQRDLEAASAVQLSMLPEPARLGGVAFSGQLRPSHFISGDTYDVLRQPNGPVHFFLADVAGHGAAAALVSVASRYAVSQAILQRQAGDSLSEAMAVLNNDWPEHLPYFTMILGELRPEDGRGLLVQAGHPPPLLIKPTGSTELVGQGGLPIGVLRGASFDEVRFSFEPGDRLFVYSDGLSEAENPSGQPFTEERLVRLVQAHSGAGTKDLLSLVGNAVRNWRGADELEDDMTLLVMEAVHGQTGSQSLH